MTRECQNCKAKFEITADDMRFYDRIKVPPPTWCPECRLLRRMCFTNQLKLYKRLESLSGKPILSIYDEYTPFPVYTSEDWWSDKWDPLQCGREYDFKRPFFDQFSELYHRVPQIDLVNINCSNCEYCLKIINSKNCYLSIGYGIENCVYGYYSRYTKDSMSYFNLNFSERCYECINCYKCNSLLFSQDCIECYDSRFLFACRNCHDCFGCVNLRNKSYSIFNKQYTKSEYQKIIEEYDLGNFLKVEEVRNDFLSHKLKFFHRYSNLNKCTNVTGNHVSNSINSHYCFDISEDSSLERAKHVVVASSMTDCYDVFEGGENIQYSAEIMLTYGGSNNFGTINIPESHHIQYSIDCSNSSNLFACVGLRSKSYGILNKQYTKEEYEKLVPRIMKHMNQMPYIDKKGRIYKYGEFFPPELSPFSYNETIAQEYFPLTKEEALEKGYSWKDPEPRNYQIQIPNDKLPDHIKDAPDDIVNQIIECQHAQGSSSETSGQTAGAVCNEQCTEAFKIIQQELDFLRKMNLPLPRLCPNCRHYQRIKQRNPLKLWHRKCQCAGLTSENKVYQNTASHPHHMELPPSVGTPTADVGACPNEFETTYAPERPEIVYCEQCYLREVV